MADYIYEQIKQERHRQDNKWGGLRILHNYTWITVLSEEVGEVARAALEKDDANYREELIQVAAVAVAMIESHDMERADA